LSLDYAIKVIKNMKYLLFSVITSIILGLLLYWAYLLMVTGLSPFLITVLGLVLTGVLVLNIWFIKKSSHRVMAVAGLLVFGLLFPYRTAKNKKWDVDPGQTRRYEAPS
jgi:hypothetical protein